MDDGADIADRASPGRVGRSLCRIPLHVIVNIPDSANHRRLPAQILHKYAVFVVFRGSTKGAGLPPVQQHKSLSHHIQWQVQLGVIICTPLNGQLGQGQHQGKLVGRRKFAFVKQPLNFFQKGELGFGRQRTHGADQ